MSLWSFGQAWLMLVLPYHPLSVGLLARTEALQTFGGSWRIAICIWICATSPWDDELAFMATTPPAMPMLRPTTAPPLPPPARALGPSPSPNGHGGGPSAARARPSPGRRPVP